MKILNSLILILFISCSNNERGNDRLLESFKPPVIIQMTHYDSIEDWNMEMINEVFPRIVGQYKFADTVKLTDEPQFRKIDMNQFKWESSVFDFDTLSTDGLEIYPDYNTPLTAKLYPGAKKGRVFFPVYILNQTNTSKLFIGKDSYAFAIQEAVDIGSSNNWHSIEAIGYDFCGNGYFRRKLLSKEFIMILMPKYSGTDTTYLRTRIKIGENIIVSRPYKGVIDKKQFTISKNNLVEEEIIEEYNNWMFYGGHSKKY